MRQVCWYSKITGKSTAIESRFATEKAGRSAGSLADLQKMRKSAGLKADLLMLGLICSCSGTVHPLSLRKILWCLGWSVNIEAGLPYRGEICWCWGRSGSTGDLVFCTVPWEGSSQAYILSAPCGSTSSHGSVGHPDLPTYRGLRWCHTGVGGGGPCEEEKTANGCRGVSYVRFFWNFWICQTMYDIF